MSTLELDVSSAASITPPVTALRSPVRHKRQLTLSPSSSIVSLFSSVSPISHSRQSSSPSALSNGNSSSLPASLSSPPASFTFSAGQTSSLRSLYRRISSRLPSPGSTGSLSSSNNTSALMSPAHKTATASALPPTPALVTTPLSPTTFSHYPSAPLPVSTLRLLTAHSTYLATLSTHMSMLASFLYLVLNLLKASYHSYRHSVHVIVWCDILLVGVNVLGVGCAMGYWCSYAERRRYEWEWERRRTGKVAAAEGETGSHDELKGQQEDADEDDFDITDGEVESLLMQHSSDSEELLSPASTVAETADTAQYYPLTTVSTALQHFLSAFTLTLFYSHTFYISTIDGFTELLSLIGAFLYLVSSLFPLLLDTHMFPLEEETEASLDEFGYGIDSLAMTLYVVSSLLYLRLYYRDRPAGDMLVWLDGGFWSNVWNVGGSFCYLFAIMYGLSIRLYMSSALPPTSTTSGGLGLQPSTMGVGVGLDGGMSGWNGSMVDGTVEADDLSDLSEWQRALFNLRSSEKLMTSTGDLMYMLCAVMMEIAERQHRRRRMKGRKHTGSSGMAGGAGSASSKLGGTVGVAVVDGSSGGMESDGVAKRNGARWSESGMGVGVIDVLAT